MNTLVQPNLKTLTLMEENVKSIKQIKYFVE